MDFRSDRHQPRPPARGRNRCLRWFPVSGTWPYTSPTLRGAIAPPALLAWPVDVDAQWRAFSAPAPQGDTAAEKKALHRAAKAV